MRSETEIFKEEIKNLDQVCPQKEVQGSEEFLKKAFDDKGMTRPKEVRTNQDWYARQRYEVLPRPATALYVDTTTKEVERVSFIWLKKVLVYPKGEVTY